jgi:hypothetical protein
MLVPGCMKPRRASSTREGEGLGFRMGTADRIPVASVHIVPEVKGYR